MKTVKIAGELALADDGGGTLTLRFGSGITPPPIPTPPADVVVIRPSGGDDRQAFTAAWDALETDQVLLVSGMLAFGDSVRLSGSEKRVLGDPRAQSGFRSTRSEPMGGAYCAIAHLHNANRCTLRGLEFDAAGHPAGGLYIEGGADNVIEKAYVHDIGWRSSDPRPMAAILADAGNRLTVRGCRVEKTGGVLDNDGCRGIWLRGQSSLLIEACIVSDTGHTGIIAELSDGAIRGNTVLRSLTNGTLYKICYRAQAPAGEVQFTGNQGEQSIGGGLMLEDAFFPLVAIEGNTWKRCGRDGSTFGAIYANEATNIKFANNTLDGCKSTGALIRTDYALFEHNTIANGPAVLHLEDTVSNVRLTASGDVSIGRDVRNVYVDGQQRA